MKSFLTSFIYSSQYFLMRNDRNKNRTIVPINVSNRADWVVLCLNTDIQTEKKQKTVSYE